MRFHFRYSLRNLLFASTAVACQIGWLSLPSVRGHRLATALEASDSSQSLDSIIPNGKAIQQTAMEATMTKDWSHRRYCVLTILPVSAVDLVYGRRRVTLEITGGPVHAPGPNITTLSG